MKTKRNYRVATWPLRNGQWIARWARLYPHRYSKHTAYGERVVMKPGRWFTVPGQFRDRKSALNAANKIAEVAVS